MAGAASTYNSASEPSDRMKSSRLEVLCDRQAAAVTPARPIAIKVIPTNGTKKDALTRPLPLVSHLDVDHAAYDPEAQGHESGRPDENDQARAALHWLEVGRILQLQRTHEEDRDGEEDVAGHAPFC